MKNDIESRRFKGVLSKEYDYIKLAYPNYEEFQSTINEPLISFQQEQNNSLLKILEIGCGTGDTTKIICSTLPYALITAIDIEEAMLIQARSKLGKYRQCDNVNFVKSDALLYLKTLKETQFDIVSSVYTFHNWKFSYREDVLKHIYRSLKPGGLFICADKIFPDDESMFHELFQKQVYSIIDAFEKLNRWDLAKKWVLHELEDITPQRVLLESKWKGKIIEAGFTNVSYILRRGIDSVVVCYKPN